MLRKIDGNATGTHKMRNKNDKNKHSKALNYLVQRLQTSVSLGGLNKWIICNRVFAPTLFHSASKAIMSHRMIK